MRKGPVLVALAVIFNSLFPALIYLGFSSKDVGEGFFFILVFFGPLWVCFGSAVTIWLLLAVRAELISGVVSGIVVGIVTLPLTFTALELLGFRLPCLATLGFEVIYNFAGAFLVGYFWIQPRLANLWTGTLAVILLVCVFLSGFVLALLVNGSSLC
jgi:hypothetical protein